MLLLLKSVEIDDDVALLRIVGTMSSADPKMNPSELRGTCSEDSVDKPLA